MTDFESGEFSVAGQIFDEHFRPLFDEETFDRAKVIFDSVGPYNQRSVAIQLDAAHNFGKVAEVLEAYDEAMEPIAAIPDELARALRYKMFADYIYLHVILEGDVGKLFSHGREIPASFDRLDPPVDAWLN